MNSNQTTKKLTVMGILAAMSIVFVYVIRFPLLPAAPFLEYEPGDIPILICSFLYGPVSGLILTVIVSILQGITVSAGSGIIGIIMHIFATGFFAFLAGLFYIRNKSRKNAIIGLSLGTIAMIIVMCILNIVLTPIFMGIPRSEVLKMILPIIVPFNFLKAGINSILTFIVYKKISKIVLK